MIAHLGRRGFVGWQRSRLSTVLVGAAAGRARPSAMGFDEARHLAVAHDLRRDAGRDPRLRGARLCRGGRSAARQLRPQARYAGAGVGESKVRPSCASQQQAAAADSKMGVDGKPLQIVRPIQEQGRELRNWWVEEMLVTDQPLVERMMLFWHNHFTSSLQKVRYAPALYLPERAVPPRGVRQLRDPAEGRRRAIRRC